MNFVKLTRLSMPIALQFASAAATNLHTRTNDCHCENPKRQITMQNQRIKMLVM